MRRIGVLMATGESDPETKAYLSEFTQGLREAGLQSRAVRMDVRSASIDIDRTRMAKELIALQPDVILSHGTATTAVLQDTKSRRHRKLTLQAISPGHDFRFDGLSCKLNNARSDCANRRDAQPPL
jgi:hypothetical protein